jgi:hypothetical protein
MAVAAITTRSVPTTNIVCGRSKLTGGTVTIANKQVADTTLIFASGDDGSVTGILTITRTSGTSFTITSSVGGDTGFVAWMLVYINDGTSGS